MGGFPGTVVLVDTVATSMATGGMTGSLWKNPSLLLKCLALDLTLFTAQVNFLSTWTMASLIPPSMDMASKVRALLQLPNRGTIVEVATVAIAASCNAKMAQMATTLSSTFALTVLQAVEAEEATHSTVSLIRRVPDIC